MSVPSMCRIWSNLAAVNHLPLDPDFQVRKAVKRARSTCRIVAGP
jgi:hypothetical protein